MTTEELNIILAEGYTAKDNPHKLNLRSKLTVLTYLRIASEIKQQLPPSPALSILDWGAGAGQMSYLLARRGYAVWSFDYREDTNKRGTVVQNEVVRFGERELSVTRSTDPVKLPYPDGYFAAVLSCGVLEHVSHEVESLREIRRVLKPGGLFFIYQLPQKGSWLEFIIGRFKLGYVHERKYTAQGIKKLLATEGFGVYHWRRANMLPKNFTGMPARLKQSFEKQPELILKVDHALSRLPLFNQLGGILELIAYKT